jgi:hypothetical protein
MDWPDALDYCESLVHDLNHWMTDWRLPDAHELQSIVYYTRSPDTTDLAAIDELFYTTEIINEANQIDFGWYWTSTTRLDGASVGSQAVYVAFGRNFPCVDMTFFEVETHSPGWDIRGKPGSLCRIWSCDRESLDE